MRKRKIKLAVEEISRGVLSTAGNLVLFSLFYGGEYAAGLSPTSKGARQAHDKAFDDLASLDLSTLRNSLDNLRSRGLIETIAGERTKYKITAAGKRKLEEALPTYDEERVWDGKVYLVTYDVPEAQKGDRNVLRDYLLKRLGCAMLQKSVWLTVYNPTDVLREFVQSRGLEGSVLVSSLGEGGSIGGRTTKELVADVYKLDQLNDRYKAFIWEYDGVNEDSKAEAVFEFLCILQDDPQLPFELLPRGWKGREAYELFKEISPI
jgi:phenylacetic acid degradation operon negative regulatory protein